ncbi:MAG: TPM domain-containing protein [Clostridia bacterium]
MKKILACALLLLMLGSPALAFNVVKPDAQFYVLDDANVLSAETEQHIIDNNVRLEKACGAQIVFVAIETTGSASREDYAYKLFNDWGIGAKDKNNGVLILLATQDDDGYFLQGSGLERNLSSGDLADLVDQYLMPYFNRQDYDTGSRALFDALFDKVSSIYNTGLSVSNQAPRNTSDSNVSFPGGYTERQPDRYSHKEESDGFSFFDIVIAIVVIGVILAFFAGMRGRGGCGCLPSMMGGFLGGLFSGSGGSRRRRHDDDGPFGGGFGGGGFGGGGFGGGGHSGGGFGGGFGGGGGGGGHSGGGGGSRGGGGGFRR